MSKRVGDVIDRVCNTVLLNAQRQLEYTVPFWPAPLIDAVQQRRLRRMVAHAYETVPFYRRAMDERGLRPGDLRAHEDLARLPLIDGEIVQSGIDDFTSSAVGEADREVFHTSGSSTGVRRTIYWDLRAVRRYPAMEERMMPIIRRLAGEPPGRAGLRQLLGETAATAALRRLGRGDWAYRTCSITTQNPGNWSQYRPWRDTMIPEATHRHAVSPLLRLDEAAARMNDIRPRFVFSFGSYAEQFLRYVEESGARVALPAVWWYTGDGVSQGGRELADRLACKLYSAYQTTEVGRVGFECERRDGLHLNVDVCPIRLVDEEGHAVPAGIPGEVVVSGLRNRAMVLLNYRIGDRAILDPEPCPCGRTLPLLRRLEGRRSDVLRLADGRSFSAFMMEALFRDALRPTRKVQLAQPTPGAVHWRVVPFAGADPETLQTDILTRAKEALGEGTRVTVEFVADIPSTPAGKFRKVLSVNGASQAR